MTDVNNQREGGNTFASTSLFSGPMENPGKRQRIIRQTSPFYFMGFVGALIYYIQHANGFWMGVLGFLKAIIWPALFVYKLLEYFKM